MPADNMPAGRPKASFLHEPMLIVLLAAAFRLGLAHGLASKAVDPRGHMFQDCTVPFLVQSVRMQPYESVTCEHPKGTLVTMTTVDAAFGFLFGMIITQLAYVANALSVGFILHWLYVLYLVVLEETRHERGDGSGGRGRDGDGGRICDGAHRLGTGDA